MKKIFAIALAVVMVLSMASAFALSDCYANFAWPCDPDVMYCGRGSVEIVPVVKVNNGCGGYDYQINTCAGAVADDEIYFALKLNVDANPDAAANAGNPASDAFWWDAVEAQPDDADAVAATHIDVTANDDVTLPAELADPIEFDTTVDTGIDWDADVAKSYYYLVEADGNDLWIDVTDEDLDLKDVVFEATLAENANAAKTKVCAELVSYDDGYGFWVYGDYEVTVAENSLTVVKGDESVVYTIADETETVTATSAAFQAEVNKLFNLNGCTLGTCLTAKNVQKNFGWDTDGKVKDCFQWSAKASAIVDAECVVAIPKTGDASLLAWLF